MFLRDTGGHSLRQRQAGKIWGQGGGGVGVSGVYWTMIMLGNRSLVPWDLRVLAEQ